MNKWIRNRPPGTRQFCYGHLNEAWHWEVTSFKPQKCRYTDIFAGSKHKIKQGFRNPRQRWLHSEDHAWGQLSPQRDSPGASGMQPMTLRAAFEIPRQLQVNNEEKELRYVCKWPWRASGHSEKSTEGKACSAVRLEPKPRIFGCLTDRWLHFVDTDFCKINYLNYTVTYMFCKNRRSYIDTRTYSHVHIDSHFNREKNISVFCNFLFKALGFILQIGSKFKRWLFIKKE